MDRTSSMLESPLSSLGGMNLGAAGVASPFQSPFLQVDPRVVNPPLISNEFIFPDGGTKPTRGRFELAFAQIGGSVFTGAGIGGALGTIKGLREVASMSDSTISIKRTHLLNYITRNGARTGNAFGTLALLYSAIGVGLSFVQDNNDELNTAIAATSTGLIYGALSQSKQAQNLQGSELTRLQLKRAGFGFAGGLIAAATLIFIMNQDKYTQKWRS